MNTRMHIAGVLTLLHSQFVQSHMLPHQASSASQEGRRTDLVKAVPGFGEEHVARDHGSKHIVVCVLVSIHAGLAKR